MESSSPRRAGGGRWGVFHIGCTERVDNGFDDAFEVLVHLDHPESQHAKAQLAQPLVSPRVIDQLIAVVLAIDFDHQPRLQAGDRPDLRPGALQESAT